MQCGGHPGTVTINGRDVPTIVPNAPDRCTGTGLTNAYLQYAYIQALNNFAASGKGNTVILPGGQSPTLTVPVTGSTSTP